MAGTAGLPHVIVRFFTVKKVSDARKSAGWALLFIMILYTTAPAIAVFARTNMIEAVSNQEYENLPEWFTTWEETGLLIFDDKDGDGFLGFVHQAVIDEYLSKHEAPEDLELYFCGPPMMNNAVQKMGEDFGMADENIRFDDFGG